MELKKLFELAGVDVTKGKAKKLLSEAHYDLPDDSNPGKTSMLYQDRPGRRLRHASRSSPGIDQQLAYGEGVEGLRVWTNEGEEMVSIVNLDPGLSQDQFDAVMKRYLTPREFEVLADFPAEMQVVTQEELESMDDISVFNQYTLKEYIALQKAFFRKVTS